MSDKMTDGIIKDKKACLKDLKDLVGICRQGASPEDVTYNVQTTKKGNLYSINIETDDFDAIKKIERFVQMLASPEQVHIMPPKRGQRAASGVFIDELSEFPKEFFTQDRPNTAPPKAEAKLLGRSAGLFYYDELRDEVMYRNSVNMFDGCEDDIADEGECNGE